MSPAETGAGGLETELDALYTAPLDQFVARRDALAKRLREAGATDESRRIKALRKPSVVAWAINRLHLEQNGLAEIAAASEALRVALQNPRSADDRRVAIEARRKALEGATSAVVALVETAGSSVSPALLRRIERTVLAVSTGTAGERESPAPGRLDQELEPPGFEAIFEAPAPTLPSTRTPEAQAPVAPTPPTKTHSTQTRATRSPPAANAPGPAATTAGSAKKASPSQPAPVAETTPEPRGNVRDFQREAALRKAQAALDQADGDLERATDTVDAARMRVTDAEKALAAARQEVDAARRELAAVRSRRDEARRELDRAKKERNG